MQLGLARTPVDCKLKAILPVWPLDFHELELRKTIQHGVSRPFQAPRTGTRGVVVSAVLAISGKFLTP